jgi:TonB family protein
MSAVPPGIPDVFSLREIAQVAGVSTREARDAVASAGIRAVNGRYLTGPQAARAVRLLREGRLAMARGRELFETPLPDAPFNPGPLVASGTFHALVAGVFLLLTTVGISRAHVDIPSDFKAVRMVFLAVPGPGGGGGGGGLRQPAPPPRAQMTGTNPLRSPVPVERAVRTPRPQPAEHRPSAPPPPITPAPRPADPPPPVAKPDPVPPVVAPVATAPGDTRDRAGVLSDSPSQADSRGPGVGGGSGTGQGTGIGEGTGPGIGPGSGGGTGGGPYHPGSGITPPEVVREVKPDYTEEARRRGIGGDVVLEIVVRADGTVGPVRVLQGLGSGLDERAAEAVRQWRFSPARRLGTPVDVIVEVAVEFKLR